MFQPRHDPTQSRKSRTSLRYSLVACFLYTPDADDVEGHGDLDPIGFLVAILHPHT